MHELLQGLTPQETTEADELARDIASALLRKSYYDIQELYGEDVLGYGCYSIVLAHPTRPDLAIKISDNAGDGGVLYAFWARAHPHLKGVPRIYSINQFYNDVGDLITAIVMKRYDRTICEDCDDTWITKDVTSSDLHYALRETLYNEHLKFYPKVWFEQNNLLDYFYTITSIRDFFDGSAEFDLHNDNCMIDLSKGELIITDPLSKARD